jgi:uncharacterized membrane protein YdjX (TVP38/TMEM64 family)
VQKPVTVWAAPGRFRWGTVGGVLFVVGLTVVLPLFGSGERLRDLVEQTGAWSPVVYVAAKAAATVVAPLSGVPLKAASGALLGVGWGIFYSVLGDVIGGCVCFGISRLLGRGIVERFSAAGAIDRVEEFTSSYGDWRMVLFGRLTLSPVYNLVSYAAGLTKLPFWQYLLVTVFGGVLHTSFVVVLGASVVLDWRLRVTVYAGIAVLAFFTMIGSRRLQRILVGGAQTAVQMQNRDHPPQDEGPAAQDQSDQN